MSSDPLQVAEKVAALIEPIIEEGGRDGGRLELVDVVYLSEGGTMVLRVLVDTEGGDKGGDREGGDKAGVGKEGAVGIDDLSRLSKRVSTLIDESGAVQGAYSLEVSSPGLDRPLKKERHYARALGLKAQIKTKEPVDGIRGIGGIEGIGGRRNFKGTIKGVDGGVVSISDSEGRSWSIEIANIEKARLVIDI